MNSEKQLVSVHICPKCGHVMNLAEIEFNAITTGILSCDWSGPIRIQIVDEKSLVK